MFLARPAAIFVLALLLASGAGAATRSQSSNTLAAPQKLHGFLLRAHEPSHDTFTRTPSFAWQPVMGANRYEFQLASSRTFGSGALLARKTTRTPAVSLAISLPWVTGTPYSLYARVRALAPNGAPTPWSELFGFNMRWTNLPTPLEAAPGLIRWTPVDGATAYQVWYVEPDKIFKTQTTVADEREYYTLHQGPDVDRNAALADPGDPRAVRERPQRAARRLVRPVEPRLHVDEHAVHRRRALDCGDDLRHDFDGGRTGRASRDARIHVQRRHRPQRRSTKSSTASTWRPIATA